MVLLGWLLLADGHFSYFAQVKLDGHLLTLSKSKIWTNSTTLLAETGCLSNFLGYLSMLPALHPGFSDLWRSPPALSSILTTFGCRLFLIVQASSLLIHSPFPTQSVRLPLVTYPSLCSTCVTYRTPCHASGHQVLPIQPLLSEAEDFRWGEKYFKHVPLLTYLIYFSPKGVQMVDPIYVSGSPRRTLISLSLVLNQRFKSPIYC